MTGIILSSESGAAGRVSISSLDTNGDGIISDKELEAAKSGRTQDPTVSSENAATGSGSQVRGSMISMLLQISSMDTESEPALDTRDLFSAIDADGDGRITQDEYVAARPEDVSEEEATADFVELDTEQTGFLTEEAFTAGFADAPQSLDDATYDASAEDTVSIFDILAEMERVINAYRENGGEAQQA
ncbi:EF-hand domain-containing protein [Rhizobium wuzhouense]|uniref:EF-hand domain-containing protein n=1 Tax=Rhizobium wuzhouense TaxID=1986026 RepID=A0ABX5NLZ9_9HYPH|nr:EF-hand domain-containing protein [Rhizobium wuzhouense]PYB70913.1 hypothetical protein DMY87_20880 [Rhizobium wuzhouense]